MELGPSDSLADQMKEKKEISGDCQELSLNDWVDDGGIYWDEENEREATLEGKIKSLAL